MSLQKLVAGDCGNVSSLQQFGEQITRDIARKDEAFADIGYGQRQLEPDGGMVNEFLRHVTAPQQSFEMHTLLQEMRDIEESGAMGGQTYMQPMGGNFMDATNDWTQEYAKNIALSEPLPPRIADSQQNQMQMKRTGELFLEMNHGPTQFHNEPFLPNYVPYTSPLKTVNNTDDFFQSVKPVQVTQQEESVEDWITDYQTVKTDNEQSTLNYNAKFWQNLQDEWQKLAEEQDYPWLTEINENYDPYKMYEFTEENPMSELTNAFEKGKEYLVKGDIPSAVLCFEVAAKKEPENAEIWEYLGVSQAENERDPQGIAALKRSLEIRPENQNAKMALAICYTNESLQNHALKMLTNWLEGNPMYKHLVHNSTEQAEATNGASIASSLISSNRLREIQALYLNAARLNPQEIDADVQEALGVLYNLSSEFDKAADCFRAALQVKPNSAKVWNRLGASLANGSRSVEAVDAYQQALRLQPGFIRVRYNVGVCCMNLKAYKQAVEHLLIALNMQANSAALKEISRDFDSVFAGQHQMSESIWSTLKMVISLMGRNDLQGYVADKNLTGLNNAFKDSA